jgi:hypothetical protein
LAWRWATRQVRPYNTLTSGSGADQFWFATALTGVDTITDLTPSQHDKIVLSEAEFPRPGRHGTRCAAHFHLNPIGRHSQLSGGKARSVLSVGVSCAASIEEEAKSQSLGQGLPGRFHTLAVLPGCLHNQCAERLW